MILDDRSCHILFVIYFFWSLETSRLDALVDDTFNYFKDRYVEGEIVNCLWDDGVT